MSDKFSYICGFFSGLPFGFILAVYMIAADSNYRCIKGMAYKAEGSHIWVQDGRPCKMLGQ